MLCIFSQKDSLTVIPDALVEQTVKQATVYDKFQFERIGFFSVDPDSSKDKVSTPFHCAQSLKPYAMLLTMEQMYLIRFLSV